MWGIAIDASRHPNGLWVVDTSNNRVLGWRDVTKVREGTLAVDADGRLLVGNIGAVFVFERPLQAGAHSRKLIDISALAGLYYQPLGLATDSASHIYLTAGNQVYRFSRDGSGPSLQLGGHCAVGDSTGVPEGLGRASLCVPTGLAVGLRDEIFVSDAGANRVVVFDNL